MTRQTCPVCNQPAKQRFGRWVRHVGNTIGDVVFCWGPVGGDRG